MLSLKVIEPLESVTKGFNRRSEDSPSSTRIISGPIRSLHPCVLLWIRINTKVLCSVVGCDFLQSPSLNSVMLLLQMSHYLTVPANRQETPPVRKVFFQQGQSKSQFKARFYENENYVPALKSLIILSFVLLDSFGAFEQLCPAVGCRPGSLCINTILFFSTRDMSCTMMQIFCIKQNESYGDR